MNEGSPKSRGNPPLSPTASTRNTSLVMYEKEEDMNVDSLKIENLADCVKIEAEEFTVFLDKLKALSDNTKKLEYLRAERLPYLFTSDNLAKILDTTVSLTSKFQMIQMIGPRLTDPKEKMEYFQGLFKGSGERERISEIMKTRHQTLVSTRFRKSDSRAFNSGASGGRGRGAGRGEGTGGRIAPASPLGGRIGGGGFPGVPKNIVTNVMIEEESEDREEEDGRDVPSPIPSISDVKYQTESKRYSLDASIVRKLSGNYTTQTQTTAKVDSVVAQLLLEKESRPPSIAMKKLRSSENLTKKVSTPTITEEQVQASAAILSAMFPHMSAGVSKPDAEDPVTRYLNLLGLDKNGKNKLTGEFAQKSDVDMSVNAELSLVLKALKMSVKDASSMVDIAKWKQHLEENDIFIDADKVKNEQEIFAVCKVLGMSASVANRFAKKLENWEDKVVMEKVQKKDGTSDADTIMLSAAKSKLYDSHNLESSSEDTPCNRSFSDSFSIGTRSPTTSMDGIGSPPKVIVNQNFAARADKYNRVKGLTNEEIIESLLKQSTERRVNAAMETPTPTHSLSVSSDRGVPTSTIKHSTEKSTSKDVKGPEEINPGIVRQRSMTFNGGTIINKSFDEKAAPAAFTLNMDTNSFLHMSPEDAVGFDQENQLPLFTFKELVRRNHCKQFAGLQHRELEKHLTDEEFEARFLMKKEKFRTLTKWRQIAMKKALTLF